MAFEKSPAFQMYPADFLSDDHVAAMESAAVGIFTLLICHCWLAGSVANEDAVLIRLGRTNSKVWRRVHAQVRAAFIVRDGRLFQPRLEREREKQAQYRALRAKAGRASAEQRANRRATEGQQNSPESSTKSKSSSSSSSLSTLSLSLSRDDCDAPVTERAEASPPKRARARAGAITAGNNGDGLVSEEIGDRAAKLIENYAGWYTTYRHGARLRLLGNSLEFQAACSLVQTWDDLTLSKLARIVLESDDDFIAGTDRSFKIFSLKATWADDRLRQWEQEHGRSG